MKYLNFFILIFFLVGAKTQDKSKQYALKADKLYRDSNFVEAEENYRKSNIENPGFNNQYNLANTLYQQGRFKEAKIAYERAASGKDAVDQKKAMALYNLGNSNMNEKNYEAAINSYKESLKIKPNDPEAKLNLSKALQLQKIQQQQKQEQQNQQDQQNQQQKQEKQNQQEQQKNNSSKPENQSPQENSNEKKNQESEGDSNNKLSKEQVEQILKLIDAKDKNTKEKLQKAKKRKQSFEKDW